jgi:hypothetical protein
MAPAVIGSWSTPLETSPISSDFIGTSLAAKSTVPVMNWRTPAPDPTDW